MMMGMEFYNETKHTAKKEHICEMCGRKIQVGEKYYQEKGKFYGEFFSRFMHTHCHNMEAEFCLEIDNEFSWDQITEYIQDNYCSVCEHNDDCCVYVTDCPKIIEMFSNKEDPKT